MLATANWYFMALSTFMITIVGTLVTELIVAPWLGEYDESKAEEGALDASKDGIAALSDARERRGLRYGGFTVIGLDGLILALTLPEGGAFRDPNAAADATAVERIKPLLKSVVALIFVFFLVPAWVFGRSPGPCGRTAT